MRSFLIFTKNGEILEKKTKSEIFDISNFTDFKSYKIYDNYIVLYNESFDKVELNLTVFNFTKDRYTDDIGLIKIEKLNKIKNLNVKSYIKEFEKLEYEKIEEEIDILDITKNYKDLIDY